jgi:hypothetical protein
MPSCDFLFFNLSSDFQKYVIENKLQVEISNEPKKFLKDIENDLNKVVFMSGYQHGFTIKIYPNSEEYFETLDKKIAPFPFYYIVKDDKHLGIVKISKFNKIGLFTFYGTTTPGSSGSLILNSTGKAIGMSFGNYSDIEQKERSSELCAVDSFDVLGNELEINYRCSKNLN